MGWFSKKEIENGVNEFTDGEIIVKSNTWTGEVTMTQDGQEATVNTQDEALMTCLKDMIWNRTTTK